MVATSVKKIQKLLEEASTEGLHFWSMLMLQCLMILRKKYCTKLQIRSSIFKFQHQNSAVKFLINFSLLN